MKHILYIIIVVSSLIAVAANAAGNFAGVAYKIEVTSGAAPAIADGCMRFAEDGDFTMAGEKLPMVWATEAHDAGAVMAVTAPGKSKPVPYHVGIHGSVRSGQALTGSGLDDNGNAFTFSGVPLDDCGVYNPEPASIDAAAPAGIPKPPTRSRVALVVDAVNRMQPQRRAIQLVNAIFAPVLDPCWQPAGWAIPCDPPLDPFAAGSKTARDAASQLTGRSFRLSLGTSGQGIRMYCWTFGAHGRIDTETGTTLRWSADGSTEATTVFQVIGAGDDNRGMAYHGEQVGTDILRVAGIEARDAERIVTYGYGRATASCPAVTSR